MAGMGFATARPTKGETIIGEVTYMFEDGGVDLVLSRMSSSNAGGSGGEATCRGRMVRKHCVLYLIPGLLTRFGISQNGPENALLLCYIRTRGTVVSTALCHLPIRV